MNNTLKETEQKALEMQKELLAVLEKHGCRDFLFLAGFRNEEQTYIHGLVGKLYTLSGMVEDFIERDDQAKFFFSLIDKEYDET